MMHRSPNSAAALILTLVLAVVGASTFNVLPLLTSGAAATLGFTDQQVGVMSLAISLGSGTSALFAGLWVRSVNWSRAALIALGGMLAANLLAMLVHRYWEFVLVQGAAGFFASAVFYLAMTILSDRRESARTFGVSYAVQGIYQVAALLVGPALLRLAGLNAVLAMLAAFAGLAMLLAPFLPPHGRTVISEGNPTRLLKPATLIALMGMGLYFVNAGAFWTYVELMGQARGMTSRFVANCVAGGVAAGALGGALAWLLGNRLGRLCPLIIAAILTVAAAVLLRGSSAATFLASSLLYFFSWNYSLAYQLAIVNAVDVTGRGVAVSGAFGYLGAAGGAGLAGLLVTPGDYSAVTWLVAVAVCVSTALFVLSSVVKKYADDRCGVSEDVNPS